MKTIFKYTIIVPMTLYISCKDIQSKKEVTKEPTMQISDDKWYFEMAKDKEEKLFEDLSKIELGDSVAHVIAILGNPTYDQTAASKETGQFLWRHLSYCVRKKDKNLANNNDQSADLFFNATSKLIMMECNVHSHEYKKGELPRK